MGNKKKAESSKAKTYKKPEIKEFGSVKDLTKTHSTGGRGDAGAFPRMHCISAPPQVDEHRLLLSDDLCQVGFKKAIEAAVRPGSVVVDLGTGSGIHTLFALQAGARKVYAIESDSILQVAREVIATNGYADKVEFLHGDSRQIELPEKADVLISNIGFLYSLKCLPDACARFLKQGGIALPSAVELSMVPYTDAEFYRTQIAFWDKKIMGHDFSALKTMAVHHPHYMQLSPAGYLAKSVNFDEINLSVKGAAKRVFQHEFTADRSGPMHAIGGWYKFLNGGEVLVSTEPPYKLNKEIWTNFVLPLERPLEIKAGDKISCEVAMDCDLIADSSLWTWEVSVNSVAKLKQSSFNSLLLNNQTLN